MKKDLFGNFIKRARKAQKLSQVDLQDLSEASLSVIYKLENGRTDVAMSSLLAVADALGVELVLKSPLGEEVSLNG